MARVFGVCLLPATGEFTYDTVPAQGARWRAAFGDSAINRSPRSIAITRRAGPRPTIPMRSTSCRPRTRNATTVALVVAWFGNSTDAASCQIYPSTTYIDGEFESWNGAAWASANWQCSSLTQSSCRPDPDLADRRQFTYGGTPSDQSVVRCIRRPQIARLSRDFLSVHSDGRDGQALARSHRAFLRPVERGDRRRRSPSSARPQPRNSPATRPI